MESRRNFAPPIYNERRVLEAPLPNLDPDVVIELDINAEIVIQDAIENIGTIAELNNERSIAQSNINEIAVGGENALPNINGLDIEYIKLETPALEIHEDDIADFDILLLDESDPLESTANHSDEITNAIESNGAESIGEEKHIESLLIDNSAGSNNIGVASGSGIQRRFAPPPVRDVSDGDESESDESVHSDHPNVANSSRDETCDNECEFVLISGVFPLPISTPDHNLVKRDDDKLSGKIAYRNEVP